MLSFPKRNTAPENSPVGINRKSQMNKSWNWTICRLIIFLIFPAGWLWEIWDSYLYQGVRSSMWWWWKHLWYRMCPLSVEQASILDQHNNLDSCIRCWYNFHFILVDTGKGLVLGRMVSNNFLLFFFLLLSLNKKPMLHQRKLNQPRAN